MSSRKKLYIKDMKPDQIAKVEARMRPREISLHGRIFKSSGFTNFLGETEGLREVIEKDSRTLEKHGITHEQIADRLEALVREPQTEILGADGKIDKKKRYEFHTLHFRGMIGCPFDDVGYSSTIITIKKLVRKKASGLINRLLHPLGKWEVDGKISFHGVIGKHEPKEALTAHMIRNHHFFGGSEEGVRVDPETAIRVLEIKPGVDYSIKAGEEKQ